MTLPRVLVIDDLFGRTLGDRPNPDRRRLCTQFRLQDVTGDEAGFPPPALRDSRPPLAAAVFHRGQSPAAAGVGDVVRNDPDAALAAVARGWDTGPDGPPRWALVFLDLHFRTGPVTAAGHARDPGVPAGDPADRAPDGYFGLHLLDLLRGRFPDLPVAILSAEARGPVSRAFAARGAVAFLARDAGPDAMSEVLNRHGLLPDPSGRLVGRSVGLLYALQQARRHAAGDQPVLIRGETGAGKELVAEYVHGHSPRAAAGLVAVSVPGLPPSLVEAHLFGHARGAFTGADRDRRGVFAEAGGGTLFLDEVGDTPADVQVKLLRVLETGRYRPVGGDRDERTDARVVSATNRDVEAGAEFRSDLFERLRAGGTVLLPPLRDRREDLPLLAERFVRLAEQQYGGVPRQIDPAALDRLRDYSWPGNVRELRTVLGDAVRRFPDLEYLVPHHLDLPAGRGPAPVGRGPAPAASPVDSPPPAAEPAGLAAEVAGLLAGVRFPATDTAGWAGEFPAVQAVVAGFLLRYLSAALAATARRTPDRPGGDVVITPAVRLLTGEAGLKTTGAADLIKRLAKIDPEATAAAAAADERLRAAVDAASRARRRE